MVGTLLLIKFGTPDLVIIILARVVPKFTHIKLSSKKSMAGNNISDMIFFRSLSQPSGLSWEDLLPFISFCRSPSFFDLLDWITYPIS